MNKTKILTSVLLCLMTALFFSCSKDDNAEQNRDNSAIIGEWQLLKTVYVYKENGKLVSTEEIDHSAFEKPSMLIFTADKKIDFKVYEKYDDGELSLDHQTGTYKFDEGKLTLLINTEDDNIKLELPSETYKIENNTLTLSFKESSISEPTITTITAKRIK